MTATVSPVRLVSPASMRFGVWRSLSARRVDDRSTLTEPQTTADAFTSAHSVTAAAAWRAEWRLGRKLPVPVEHLLRGWWAASLLGLMGMLLMWATTRGALSTPPGSSHHAASMLIMTLGAIVVGRLALLGYTRHAGDHDRIAMSAAHVRVDRSRGGRTQSLDFHPRWVRVEPLLHDRSLICLSGQGRQVVVGEFVPASERRQLAEELRWALRHLDD